MPRSCGRVHITTKIWSGGILKKPTKYYPPLSKLYETPRERSSDILELGS